MLISIPLHEKNWFVNVYGACCLRVYKYWSRTLINVRIWLSVLVILIISFFIVALRGCSFAECFRATTKNMQTEMKMWV